MPDGHGLWKLAGFEEAFEQWLIRESPSADVSLAVAEWMLSRAEDPYEGARREPGFPDLWTARIRGTAEGRRTKFNMVLCTFRVLEPEHVVSCDNFATLGYPV
ncbi:hypothetical protein ACI2K4_11250 [Micromonospora sp. NPDC050397]|uniref:hypothetical protein n=1 Tax=Micromonospora sp. NPDC050397 TaxID=3364279 RepID=UPI00384AA263